MKSEYGQLLCLYTVIFLFYQVQPYVPYAVKTDKQIVNILRITAFAVGITILNKELF